MNKHLLMSGLMVGLLSGLGSMKAEEPKSPEAGGLTVIDGNGKEQKLKTWKVVVGTRRLSWLSEAAPAKEEKEKEKEQEKEKKVEVKEETGPEALEFREENSTNFAKGVLTYIPLERIRAIDYDNEKQTATVRVAVTDKPEADEVLTGPTKFQGENKLTIEAEVDKGGLGVAEVKFLAGIPKGIKGIRFPAPKIANAAVASGRMATIIAADKDKTTFKASDLQPLYRLPEGGFKTMPTLMFKKTLKLDLAKIQRMRLAETGAKDASEFEVTLKDGETNTLTLLKTLPSEDKPPVLEGFVGRVGAGYKVFPIGMIGEVLFEEAGGKEK